MLTLIATSVAGNFLWQLVIAAARTTLLAAFAAVLLKMFRVNVTSARLLIWKAVLCAGLTMPLLALLVPAVSVPIPGFVSHDLASPSPATRSNLFQSDSDLDSQPVAHTRTYRESSSYSRSGLQLPGANQLTSNSEASKSRAIAIASLAYLCIAMFLLSRLLVGLFFARRLVRTVGPIRDPRIATLLVPGGSPLSVCESTSISVPVTIGILKPTVVLPLAWRGWDDAKLQSVLAHEFSHALRFDTLTKIASLMHRASFWFSPLAWWLNRYLSELAEEASDEAALSAGAERNQYARDLLGFFSTVQGAPGRVRWQGVSMAASGNAERRLEKILAWRGDTKMKARRWTLVMVTAIAISATCLIAAARPTQDSSAPQTTSGTQEQRTETSSQPAVPAMPAMSAAPSMPGAPAMPAISAPPSMPGTPALPIAPAAPSEPGANGNHRHGYFYSSGSDDEQRFVIVSGKMDGFTMSGSSEDARHAENLKKQISGDFIWFERDEKSYIIRDQATVDRARQLWAPQEELGKKQEELGKQQEALGKQQEELGARMQQVHVKVPDMTAELEKLKAELHELGPNATMEQIGKIQSEIGELQSKIGELQSHAGDEQGKIGEEMGALGEKQGKLGEQQGELGRQQGELAERANKEMKKLLDDAIKNGTAKPETELSGGASL